MGVSKLSAKVFFKVNYSFKIRFRIKLYRLTKNTPFKHIRTWNDTVHKEPRLSHIFLFWSWQP